jgi:hypothetical protein
MWHTSFAIILPKMQYILPQEFFKSQSYVHCDWGKTKEKNWNLWNKKCEHID